MTDSYSLLFLLISCSLIGIVIAAPLGGIIIALAARDYGALKVYEGAMKMDSDAAETIPGAWPPAPEEKPEPPNNDNDAPSTDHR